MSFFLSLIFIQKGWISWLRISVFVIKNRHKNLLLFANLDPTWSSIIQMFRILFEKVAQQHSTVFVDRMAHNQSSVRTHRLLLFLALAERWISCQVDSNYQASRDETGCSFIEPGEMGRRGRGREWGGGVKRNEKKWSVHFSANFRLVFFVLKSVSQFNKQSIKVILHFFKDKTFPSPGIPETRLIKCKYVRTQSRLNSQDFKHSIVFKMSLRARKRNHFSFSWPKLNLLISIWLSNFLID